MRKKDKKRKREFGGGRGRNGARAARNSLGRQLWKNLWQEKSFHWHNAKNLTISSRSLLFFYIFAYPVNDCMRYISLWFWTLKGLRLFMIFLALLGCIFCWQSTGNWIHNSPNGNLIPLAYMVSNSLTFPANAYFIALCFCSLSILRQLSTVASSFSTLWRIPSGLTI